MISPGLKKNFCVLGVLLAVGCGSKSESTEPGAEPPPPQSDNVAASASVRVDAWSARSTFGLNWSWISPVKSENLLEAEFTLVPPTGQSLTSIESLKIEPWMPSMGHGTSTREQKISPVDGQVGKYKVSGIYFIMAGPWEIRLTATVNGSPDKASLKVQVE